MSSVSPDGGPREEGGEERRGSALTPSIQNIECLLPGDVILFAVRVGDASALTRGIHAGIRRKQMRLGAARVHARITHVALYAGGGKIWQSTKAKGVHLSSIESEIGQFDLSVRRYRADGFDAITDGARVVKHCSSFAGKPYDNTTIALIARMKQGDRLRVSGNDSFVCSALVHVSFASIFEAFRYGDATDRADDFQFLPCAFSMSTLFEDVTLDVLRPARTPPYRQSPIRQAAKE